MIKGICKAIKNEAKEQKVRFLGMLQGTLSAGLLGNLLTGKTQIERVKVQLEQVKAQLELAKIFNTASSFNKFWNTKILSKWA